MVCPPGYPDRIGAGTRGIGGGYSLNVEEKWAQQQPAGGVRNIFNDEKQIILSICCGTSRTGASTMYSCHIESSDTCVFSSQLLKSRMSAAVRGPERESLWWGLVSLLLRCKAGSSSFAGGGATGVTSKSRLSA